MMVFFDRIFDLIGYIVKGSGCGTVDRALPPPEIHGSNSLSTIFKLYWNDENEEKRDREWSNLRNGIVNCFKSNLKQKLDRLSALYKSYFAVKWLSLYKS